jgi:hypothetical protein
MGRLVLVLLTHVDDNRTVAVAVRLAARDHFVDLARVDLLNLLLDLAK